MLGAIGKKSDQGGIEIVKSSGVVSKSVARRNQTKVGLKCGNNFRSTLGWYRRKKSDQGGIEIDIRQHFDGA